VPFDAAEANRSGIVTGSDALQAQGYTPITYVLGLAADDVKPEAGEHVIVLVSDGKETCEGDPCLLARKLAEADAALTIHTIGFGADYQAQSQLQCIARAARGQYFDANSAGELVETMGQAATAELETVVVAVKKDVPGILAVENGQFHHVFDAETGENVATIGSKQGQVSLPAGIYNVEFGDNLLWKSVEVVGGETTTIRAGKLVIKPNQYHLVLDPETGEELVTYGSSTEYLALPPGIFDVSFDDAIWRGVEIGEGEETVLRPAVLTIANNQYHLIRDAGADEEVATYSSSASSLTLPPGSYDVMFENAAWRVTLVEGEASTLNPGGVAVTPKGYHKILFPDGSEAATLASSDDRVMLPPGSYLVDIDGQQVPVEIAEGKVVEIRVE
jgi:hypothetical protein